MNDFFDFINLDRKSLINDGLCIESKSKNNEFLIFVLTSCNSNDNMENGNNLKNESSPYLLQHAENPVNWNPWNQKYLDLAEKDNKLVIISVGYASCHWCHVMERESFCRINE